MHQGLWVRQVARLPCLERHPRAQSFSRVVMVGRGSDGRACYAGCPGTRGSSISSLALGRQTTPFRRARASSICGCLGLALPLLKGMRALRFGARAPSTKGDGTSLQASRRSRSCEMRIPTPGEGTQCVIGTALRVAHQGDLLSIQEPRRQWLQSATANSRRFCCPEESSPKRQAQSSPIPSAHVRSRTASRSHAAAKSRSAAGGRSPSCLQ